ncbi:uncharacterized protein LOC123671627 [Harmonia axyridis]|uniref:uncharacterized protein LOC123671627 n=1 Tax=Harmonia axyridis TaxID=115357 RepID=UPI001E27938C|nr:uncharacterized protein LOC123671627 [Harmonia axyridis]
MFKNKLVGKRQLQRRIKHQTKLLKNQIDNMKIPLIRFQLDSHSYSGFETVSSNTDLLETSTDKTNFDSDSDVDLEESVDVAIDLKNKLRERVNTYNATRNSTTSLLHILKPVLHFLPIDFRTLMGTPGHTEIVKLNNRNMHYFGIENAISKKCQYGIKENAKKISLQINIDGLPLFKSSSTEFYPILGMCRALKDDSPFTIALFCGNGKPDPLESYLRNIIDEINSLKERGINYNGKVYTFDIHCFICDAPARSYLRQTVGHTSKLGCEKCHIVGDYENHRIIYAQKNLKLFNPKLDQDFIAEPLPTYIKEKSPLLRANIKMVTQFPIDPMHLLFLGVVKRLLVNYFFATSPVKLSQKIMKEIDDRVFILYEYITSDFPRKCRTFKELRRWKATEFKLFILYTFL